METEQEQTVHKKGNSNGSSMCEKIFVAIKEKCNFSWRYQFLPYQGNIVAKSKEYDDTLG